MVAGVAAAALVFGGGAGYGGAALWSATHDDDTTGSIFASSGSTSNASTKAPTAGSVEAVAQKVLPSVVMIEVSGSQESGSGSGIVLTADGTILTNNHVVEIAGDNGKIRVDFNDGTSADATVLGTDPLTDLAVIKAQGVSGLTPASIGSSGGLAVGQQVVAVGSPYGLDQTVTSGIVSALNRPVNVSSDSDSQNGSATVYPAIQTDAAINPGNSGGALVDMDGNVVGINASIRTAGSSLSSDSGSIGLGFAIPIDYAKPIVEEIVKGETPTHARLGITVSNVGASTSSDDQQQQPDQENPFNGFPFDFGQGEGGQGGQGQQQDQSAFETPGAQVQDVSAGSAGDKAGLKKGDVISKVDDTRITSSDSLVATIRSYRPGDKVTITYTRDDKEQTASVTLDSDAGSTQS